VIGADAEVAAKGLNSAAGHLHNCYSSGCASHTGAALHFVHDTSVERGFEIDRLIDQAVGRGDNR